jgi:hypothetical protein
MADRNPSPLNGSAAHALKVGCVLLTVGGLATLAVAGMLDEWMGVLFGAAVALAGVVGWRSLVRGRPIKFRYQPALMIALGALAVAYAVAWWLAGSSIRYH